jgi:hypothetical protein
MAAITMMLSYRDHFSYTTDAVLAMIKSQYRNEFEKNQALTQDEFVTLVTDLGFTGQTAFIDPDSIKNMLERDGPVLVITSSGKMLHARVIIGIVQDCNDKDPNKSKLLILDPLDPNNGNPISETFGLFNDEFVAGNGHVIHLGNYQRLVHSGSGQSQGQ